MSNYATGFSRRVPRYLAAVVLALCSTPGVAHDERQTLIAATKGKEFGIETYRVRQSGNGLRPSPQDAKQPTTTQTWAELLNAAGQPLGALHLTMHWTKQRDEAVKAFKYFERAKKYDLAWLQDTVVVSFDGEAVAIALNGQQLYSGPLTGASKEQATAVVEPMRELLRIGGAVEADLKAHYTPPQRDVTNCCGLEPGNITCTGGTYWTTAYALHRSTACESAWNQVHLRCWNAYCAGCCRTSDCNAICFEPPFFSTDFVCAARVNGTACRCSLFVY